MDKGIKDKSIYIYMCVCVCVCVYLFIYVYTQQYSTIVSNYKFIW